MKFHLAMTTYNRADVLVKSLDSLANSVVEEPSNIYIFDDNSTDPAVALIVKSFIKKTEGKFLVDFRVNKQRLNCDPNMCQAINKTFAASGSPFVITIDSDVLYNKNWLDFMKKAYEEMLKNEKIASISAYDSRLHPVVGQYNEWLNIKSSIGGLCALLRHDAFKLFSNEYSWDWEFVRACQARGYLLLCTKTGLIQHIGKFGVHSINGSMNDGSGPYDSSDTFIGE